MGQESLAIVRSSSVKITVSTGNAYKIDDSKGKEKRGGKGRRGEAGRLQQQQQQQERQDVRRGWTQEARAEGEKAKTRYPTRGSSARGE